MLLPKLISEYFQMSFNTIQQLKQSTRAKHDVSSQLTLG